MPNSRAVVVLAVDRETFDAIRELAELPPSAVWADRPEKLKGLKDYHLVSDKHGWGGVGVNRKDNPEFWDARRQAKADYNAGRVARRSWCDLDQKTILTKLTDYAALDPRKRVDDA